MGELTNLIESAITRHQKVLATCQSQQVAKKERLIELGNQTLKQRGTVFFAGNGGSFADAQHLAAELTVRYKKERGAYAALCLDANSSHTTACSNDYDFDAIFARELDALGKKGDLVIAISTSGNSANILKLVEMAKTKQIETFALTGKNGGKLIQQSDGIVIASEEVARIQEMHILIGHIFCEALDELSP